MSETTITQLSDPSGFTSDPFTDVLRDGARKLIEQAIQAELAALMAAFSGEKLEDGRARLVRHGHLPEREVMHHCPAGDLAKPNLPSIRIGQVGCCFHFRLSRSRALLRKSGDGQGSPFPRRIHPTAFVTGMPRAV